ncbi:MAG: 4-hydroxy-tetrahydrodipicolinate synthase [Pseudomonadales bacterium]
MITGSIVALVTPMNDDGSVDWKCLDSLVDWHIDQGTHGIVAVGTTGESATLDFDEHPQVIERVVKRVAGRIPVVAGSGGNATSEAIQLTKNAQEVGADACLLVTPYYNKPTQEGLYQHYKAIAEAVPIPQILYNVPGRTACDMHNDTVVRLCDIDNIIGIKDATGDIVRGKELVERTRGRMMVFSGDDPTAVDLMLNGGKGSISVTANVVPAKLSAICDAALAGDDSLARSLDAEIADLHRDLFLESNPIPCKWALAEMGLIGPEMRLPLTLLAESCQDSLRTTLKSLNLLNE